MPATGCCRMHRPLPILPSCNAWLEERCQALWHEIAHPEQSNRTVAEVYDDERSALMAMPPPFDGFVELQQAGLTDLPDGVRA